MPADEKRLLVVWHSQSGTTRALVDAVVAGARTELVDGVAVEARPALDAGPDDVRRADAVVLATPENFGYMSGGMKDFFDRSFYALDDDTRGLPYALVVKGRHDDGSGATSAVQRIVTGLGWKEARPPLLVIGDVTDEALEAATELGMTLAAALEAGVL